MAAHAGHVLGLVVVELMLGHDLEGRKRLELGIAENSDGDLRAGHEPLDEHDRVEPEGLLHGGRQFGGRVRDRHAYGRALVRRLHNGLLAERPSDAVEVDRLPTPEHEVVRAGDSRLGEQVLAHHLVHRERARKHPRADVGHSQKLAEPLHGAVFAEPAVQADEHDVGAAGGRADR